MTQHDLILKYLKQFHSITPYEAFKDLGITKLATRISEMKKQGYVFADMWVDDVNRFGEPVRFKKYSLIYHLHNYTEEEMLKLSKEQFTLRYGVDDAEYEMIMKDFQEM